MTTIASVRLVGGAELAALLGVSRGRVTQLVMKPWFPEPVARLKLGSVWELDDIERMATETGRVLDYAALDALNRTDDDESGTNPRPGV